MPGNRLYVACFSVWLFFFVLLTAKNVDAQGFNLPDIRMPGSQGSALTGPFVDRYGQKIAVVWPGKITSDADLLASKASESARLKQWALPTGEFDSFGGSRLIGWHGKATGFFRTVEHGGVWWLLTPDGFPCFYKGLDNAPALKWETTPVTGRESIFADLPAKDGPFAYAWGGDTWGTDPNVESFAFCTANLIRKYGPQWQSAFRDITKQRIKAWGFSGIGKWGDITPGIPSLPVLSRTGVPVPQGGVHPDPFDPSTLPRLKLALAPQMTPYLTDPDIVAWSLGNEGAEFISPDEIVGILQEAGNIPAKRALIDYAIDTLYGGSIPKMLASWSFQGSSGETREAMYAAPTNSVPDLDIEYLRRFYADHYYALVERAVKSIDSHHLYAGYWIVESFSQDEPDWLAIANHCDIIGFDSYDFDFNLHGISGLFRLTNKPVICGEFSFPQTEIDRGYSDFGVLSLRDELASGSAYTRYISVAAQNPYCVGVCWFQYRDEPVTGRGPGYGPDPVYGENYPFGLVDIADQPKWTLLQSVRAANLDTSALRGNLK